MLLSVINHIRPNVIYCYIWNFSHPSEIFQWSFFMKTVIFPDKLTPSSLSLSLFLFFLMFLSFASVLARIQKCQQCRSLNYSPSPCNFHNSKNMYVQIPNLSIWMNLKLCLKMLFCTEFPASFSMHYADLEKVCSCDESHAVYISLLLLHEFRILCSLLYILSWWRL